MKKIYILAIAAFAFTLNMNAQFTDDAESYDLGDMGSQNLDVWNVWSGSPNPAEDIDVVNDFANSGTQSFYVDDSGAMDVMLLVENLESGVWTLQFQAYIPAGRGGYFTLVTYTLTKVLQILAFLLMELHLHLQIIQKTHGFQ
jgi:hypothetical protein